MAVKRYIIGIDVGGTFTDILCHDSTSRELLSAKVPSVPGGQWRGVIQALDALGIDLASIAAFVHGTTIATNTLLEQKGAKTGLVTTAGFRDVLEIGLTRRLVGGLFDIKFKRQQPLVGRELRLEVPERVAADGARLANLDGFDFSEIGEVLSSQGVEAVAICFINSYVDPSNEALAGDKLRTLLPDIPISESAALLPEKGEFGRFSTCVLNAYLTPRIAQYLDTLTSTLNERGVQAPVNIMTSSGGAMTLDRAAKNAVATFLSGPVGGVTGAIRVCEMNDIAHCITFDMGGTSTDVALVYDRAPRTSHANQLGAFPLVWPQLDIHTIGAGGGSIITVQPDGTLEVGPRSAGAVPGPACYMRGGTAATISDANLVLGRLPSAHAISGGLKLSIAAAEEAMKKLAANLGGNAAEIYNLAERALHIAVIKMAGAVREVSVHRGYDPREFVLFGFGGAGPMHVLAVADELHVPRVLIPPMPGHISAFGQMLADHRRDFVTVWDRVVSNTSFSELNTVVDTLRQRAVDQLEQDGFPPAKQRHHFSLGMRYVGQSFTLSIPLQDDYAGWEPIISAFMKRHEETFGYADSDNDLEVTAVRLVSIGLVAKPDFQFPLGTGSDPVTGCRAVWFDRQWRECKVYDRAAMAPGFVLEGPAIIEEAGCTSVIPPNWRVTVLPTTALDCTSSRSEAA